MLFTWSNEFTLRDGDKERTKSPKYHSVAVVDHSPGEGGEEQLYHINGFLLAQPYLGLNYLNQSEFVYVLPLLLIFEGDVLAASQGFIKALN